MEDHEFRCQRKNVALNGVLETIDSDIIVISDADAFVSPGWLETVCSRMEEREIGSSFWDRERNPYR